MRRITQQDLEAVCGRINRMLGMPDIQYTRMADGKLRANIGNFHLDYAYGGVALHQMWSDGGGVRDVLCGHWSKRDLYARMQAFIAGLSEVKS